MKTAYPPNTSDYNLSDMTDIISLVTEYESHTARLIEINRYLYLMLRPFFTIYFRLYNNNDAYVNMYMSSFQIKSVKLVSSKVVRIKYILNILDKDNRERSLDIPITLIRDCHIDKKEDALEVLRHYYCVNEMDLDW